MGENFNGVHMHDTIELLHEEYFIQWVPSAVYTRN